MKNEKTPSLASLLSKLSPDQLKAVVEEMAKGAPESLRVLADLADARAPRRYPVVSWAYYPRPVYTDPGFYINSPVFPLSGTTPIYKTNEIYCGTGGATDLSTVSITGSVGSGAALTADNTWKNLGSSVKSSTIT
jgi:hypothetical protein